MTANNGSNNGSSNGKKPGTPAVRRTRVTAPPAFPLRPSGNNCVLRRHKTPDQSAGGVLLPTTAQGTPQMCDVLAVGPGGGYGRNKTTPPYKVGDVVYISQWAGAEITLPGADAKYLIVDTDEVLGTYDAAQASLYAQAQVPPPEVPIDLKVQPAPEAEFALSAGA